jgi:hypothetical protein
MLSALRERPSRCRIFRENHIVVLLALEDRFLGDAFYHVGNDRPLCRIFIISRSPP